jgi:hypothetical protein
MDINHTKIETAAKVRADYIKGIATREQFNAALEALSGAELDALGRETGTRPNTYIVTTADNAEHRVLAASSAIAKAAVEATDRTLGVIRVEVA